MKTAVIKNAARSCPTATVRTRRRFSVFVLGLAALVMAMGANPPQASALIIENFDQALPPNYAVLYTGNALYTLSGGSSGGNVNGNVHQNAFILSSFETLITSDQSGSGYFLYHQTVADGTPSYAGQVWGTIANVPVIPNTDYVFSFYLTNRDNIGLAQLEPRINGSAIGSPVSAAGFFADGNPAHQWQQFSFIWNSGAATTAALGLWNLQISGVGNDFAIDTISMSVVPEPGSVMLAALGLVALAASRLRRR